MAVTTRMQQSGTGQYSLTIPRTLALVLGIHKGTVLEFSLLSDFSFELKKVDVNDRPTRKKVQCTNSGQFLVNFPRVLADATGYAKGTEVVFAIDKKANLKISKR
ncbi:hypothetical protein H6504_03205 [Candidatus Woesearchaeota archaeon]|nr:hypothetical protein [Candidatus Woesearchaeota archaeon]